MGLSIVVMDIVCYFNKLIAYRHWAAMVAVILIPGFLFFQRSVIAQAITPTNTLLLNILGIGLLTLSIYTFTRRKSYRLKPEV